MTTAGRSSEATARRALEVAEPVAAPPVNPPSFEKVYRQYFKLVWSAARRFGIQADAIDDVVQEVFIVIHGKLAALERPEALRSWIYGVVRRVASNYRRAERTQHQDAHHVETYQEPQSSQPTPFEQTKTNADIELLASLLAELDEPKREVFALVEVDEMTVPEAAELLEIPLNTAYSRLRAARQAFEAALTAHEQRTGGDSNG
ncbi:MAG TPA: sigma-70 family RNA polymerase sigma factor [Polyangiaceae bacterium]|nr:sigma-70 family RNA polymerase sigma factor [Polyangiaceae bacterium]